MPPSFKIVEINPIKRGALLFVRGVLRAEGDTCDHEWLMVSSLIDYCVKVFELEVEPEFEVCCLGNTRFAWRGLEDGSRDVSFMVDNHDGVAVARY